MTLQEDNRTDEQLISAALAEQDDDAYWEIVWALQSRATREIFDTARILTQSANPDERCLGVDILAQLGAGERLFPEEIKAIFLSMLKTETHEDVIGSIGFGLGHNTDFGIINPLAALRSHPSAYVRRGVVSGLLCHKDQSALNALIELSSDPDVEVRDWATFGLGGLLELDTPEIRKALVERLSDEDVTVKIEATRGLAKHGDSRVTPVLVQELEAMANSSEPSEYELDLAFEAAEYLRDPALHPALVSVKAAGISSRMLDRAIALTRTPSPDEYEKPDDLPTTCPVCGLRHAYDGTDDWEFCPRCGWYDHSDQSLDQERAHWQERLESGRLGGEHNCGGCT